MKSNKEIKEEPFGKSFTKTDETYDCSYDFDNEKLRKKYKFVVIKEGDLDINGAIMLKDKKSLKNYLKEIEQYGSFHEILAIIKIEKWLKP